MLFLHSQFLFRNRILCFVGGLLALGNGVFGQSTIESSGGFVAGAAASSAGIYSSQATLEVGLATDQGFSSNYFTRSGDSAVVENQPRFEADPTSVIGDSGDVVEIDYDSLAGLLFVRDLDSDLLVFTIGAPSGGLSQAGVALDQVVLESGGTFSWELPLSSVDADPILQVSAYDGVYETVTVAELGVRSSLEAGVVVSSDSGEVESGSEEDLGEAEVAATATDETYTLTNGGAVAGDIVAAEVSGSDNLVVTEISIAGSHPDDFVVSGVDLPLTLEPGQSASFMVSFVPGHHGERQGEVEIFQQGSQSPLFGFRVRGNGNRPPTGGDDDVYRPIGLEPLKIFIADLLANDFDLDGDPVEFGGFVTDTTMSGRSLSLIGSEWIVYTPGEFDETPDDSFIYRVSDGRGATAPSVVWIREDIEDLIGENLESSIESLPNGGIKLSFRGIPGRLYQTQYTEQFSGDSTLWVNLGDPATASQSNGSLIVTDGDVGAGSKFYRLVEVGEGQ